MASTAAAGVFNAFAFAGAGFLFKFLDKNGYEDEMKRHNLAMEKLTAAKEKWYKSRKKERNAIITSTIIRRKRRHQQDEQSVGQFKKDHLRKQNVHKRTSRIGFLRTFRRNERIPTRRGRIGRIDRWMGSI